MKIQWQQPIPISDVHRQMMDALIRQGADERDAWWRTLLASRISTPIIRHGSGRIVITDPWAKYALPQRKGA